MSAQTAFAHHEEHHRSHRSGWLRAAVLGANDGIVSTASLLIGVASAGATKESLLIAGLAGLVAGAMSMAAGEYVSVSSQADTEAADLETERKALLEKPEAEREELARIYVNRGLELELAREVARKLMEHDALSAHARDEIGITETGSARPLQAAISSAASFTVGAGIPLLTAWAASLASSVLFVAFTSLICLALLGAVAAHAGGASKWQGAVRVTVWGVLAMLATALVGELFQITG